MFFRHFVKNWSVSTLNEWLGQSLATVCTVQPTWLLLYMNSHTLNSNCWCWDTCYRPSIRRPDIQRSLLATFASRRTYATSFHRRLRSASDSRSPETRCSTADKKFSTSSWVIGVRAKINRYNLPQCMDY